MNFVLVAATIAFALLSAPSAARAQSPAEDAVRMLAHWRCATWASMANDELAGAEHFSSGLEKGRRFVEAARSDAISDSEWNSTVPWSVAMTMTGPSTDFVLGRLFALASESAFDQVAKRDSAGQPIAPENYVLDDGVQAVIASNLMRSANCRLL